MRHWIRGAIAVACLVVASVVAQGQATDTTKDSAQDSSMKAILERETEPQPGDWVYNPGDRRDPFVSLLKPVEGSGRKGPRPLGIEGFLIQEVALKGIVKTKEGYVAMIVGPDQKSYFCRMGQRLYDGTIAAMTQTSVTFRQEVADPLQTVKVKDVTKSLYPSEEARQ